MKKLAAYGPLTHPDAKAILVTPICPHSLASRPLVLPDTAVLRISFPIDSHKQSIWCKFDGREPTELKRKYEWNLRTPCAYLPLTKILNNGLSCLLSGRLCKGHVFQVSTADD